MGLRRLYAATMATGGAVTLAAATAKVLRTNPDHDGSSDLVVTNDTAAALYLGGPDVSATVYGVALAAAAVQRIMLSPRDTLYGFSVAGGAIHVLSSP